MAAGEEDVVEDHRWCGAGHWAETAADAGQAGGDGGETESDGGAAARDTHIAQTIEEGGIS